jgi:hypothetical protein
MFYTMHDPVHIDCMLPNKSADARIPFQGLRLSTRIEVLGCGSSSGQIIDECVGNIRNFILQNPDKTLLELGWGICIALRKACETKKSKGCHECGEIPRSRGNGAGIEAGE